MIRLSDTSRRHQAFKEQNFNTTYTIVDISAEPLIRERLLELGLSPGRTLQVLKCLPLSGPIIVQAGSLTLALRQNEADHIWLADHDEGQINLTDDIKRVGEENG